MFGAEVIIKKKKERHKLAVRLIERCPATIISGVRRKSSRSPQRIYRQAASALAFFFQAEDGIRDGTVTGVQTCALPILKGQQSDLRSVAVSDDHTVLA